MGRPGALSKKISYNSMTSMLRDDYEVCDSIAGVDYHVISDEFLYLLNGRYYYDAKGELQLINCEKDKHLIGKYIRVLSPVTCNSKEGVCRHCYGHMFKINQSMFSPGTLAGLKITEPIGQGVLSSKHSQNTDSEELQFTEGYDDAFETTSSMVSIKEESNLDANLFIRLGDVCIEEFDDSETYFVKSFDLVDEKGKLVRHIEELSGARFLSGEASYKESCSYLRSRGSRRVRYALHHRGKEP